MFFPDAAAAAAGPAAAAARQIRPENTRFPDEFLRAHLTDVSQPTRQELEALAAQDPAATPRVGGFSLLRSPSPAPGERGDAPPLTWGTVADTPLHLEHEDAAAQPLQLSEFRVPPPPARELTARRLSERAGARTRAAATPSTLAAQRTPSASPAARLAALSPAARVLAGRATARAATRGDAQLLASYRSPLVAAGARGAAPSPSPSPSPAPSPAPARAVK
jgi:protein DGCR14